MHPSVRLRDPHGAAAEAFARRPPPENVLLGGNSSMRYGGGRFPPPNNNNNRQQSHNPSEQQQQQQRRQPSSHDHDESTGNKRKGKSHHNNHDHNKRHARGDRDYWMSDNERKKRRRTARSRSSRRSRSLPSRSNSSRISSQAHNNYNKQYNWHGGPRQQRSHQNPPPPQHPHNHHQGNAWNNSENNYLHDGRAHYGGRTHQNHDRDYQQQQQRRLPVDQYPPPPHHHGHGPDNRQRDHPQRRQQRHQRRSSSPSPSTATSTRSRHQRYPVPAPAVQRSSNKAWLVSDDDDAAFHHNVAAGAIPDPNNIPNNRHVPVNQHNRQVERARPSSSVQDDSDGHFLGGRGTVIADAYRIERELGEGTFGRVFECLDLTTTNNARRGHPQQQDGGNNNNSSRRRVVAIKVVRKVKRYYESALIEASIVSDVNRRGGRGTTHFAVMFDAFNHIGHFCLVFESLGKSLYDYLKQNKYQPFPMHYVRDFSQQLLEAVEFLHSFRLIHTDLKPENILLTNCRETTRGNLVLPESTHIKIIDFGGATYDDEKKSSVVNTRQYRAPEVILGCGWSMPSDLWSVGCILTELYQGELLFPTHDNIEHLAMIERITRPFPRRMLQKASHFSHQLVKEAFTSRGRHRMDKVLPPESAAFVQNMRPLESIVHPNHEWFLNLLRAILVIEPQYRASARHALQYFG